MASFRQLILLFLSFIHQLAHCSPQVAIESVSQSGEFLASAAPDLAGPTTAAPSCGGCYIVADVAGLVWYSQVFINTAATALVSVGVGNGTRATRTSIMQNEGAFTFNPQNTAPAGALTQLNFAPTANVGGAQLTSPTAYNVFSAYSVTSEFESNGVCVTTSGAPTTLSSAFSEILPAASGRVVLDANGQQSFIDFLGFSSCSAGGVSVKPTALIQITNTTDTQTSTFSNVPLAAMASLTIAPQSSPASAEAGAITSGPSTTIFPSVGAPHIVIGNMTIVPTANPIALPVYNGTFVGTATNIGGGTSGIILPSGTGTVGNGTNPGGPISFIGRANLNRADAWLGVWGAAMIGLGALVLYL
ncbi:hypothetical protein ACLMJK_005301 [Lecanora helva]